jgi:hypothetical protein
VSPEAGLQQNLGVGRRVVITWRTGLELVVLNRTTFSGKHASSDAEHREEPDCRSSGPLRYGDRRSTSRRRPRLPHRRRGPTRVGGDPERCQSGRMGRSRKPNPAQSFQARFAHFRGNSENSLCSCSSANPGLPPSAVVATTALTTYRFHASDTWELRMRFLSYHFSTWLQ